MATARTIREYENGKPVVKTVLPIDDRDPEIAREVEEVEKVEYPPEFLAWLMSEEQNAKDDELNDERSTALDFYNGRPFGDEEEGRSQIVTRDVAEVVDYMVPSVLRTMVSGDRVVEFEALDPGFKEAVEEASEAISQQFMQDQSGWRILHDSLKAGLLEKTGAIKCMVEEEKTRREEDVTASRLAELQQEVDLVEAEMIGALEGLGDQDLEQALAQATAELGDADQLGPIFRVAWFEIEPKFTDVPLPNEEFGVARDARCVNEAAYYNHATEVTLSDVREMGLDAEGLEGQGSVSDDTSLSRSRDGETPRNSDIRDGANRKVILLEEYCRYDLNGDGVAEFLRVQRVGNIILSVEEIDYGPVEEWCPFPMPHRRVGHSLADKVMDIQRTRSVLMRQALDNLYQTNVPRMLVNEQAVGDTTIDDLLTFRPGALVRWKGAVEPKPLAVPFVAGNAFQAMEILSGERESRTGITRLNQGLDADALNKTATGTALMQAQGQQIEEYIARNFAEFIGRVFAKKYRLMKDFGKPFKIVVDGEPKMVDPSTWPDHMRVNVRVGLGSGRKEQRIQYRMMMLRLQQEAAQAQDPHVTGKEIYNSVKGLVADLQLGQASDFYADPKNDAPEDPNAPSPEMQAQQAQMQLEQAKEQGRQQTEMAKLQARMQVDQTKHQSDIQLAQAKLELEQQQALAKLQMEQQRLESEAQLARERAQFEAQLAAEKAQFEQRMAEFNMMANVPENRPGGSLAA